LPTATVSPLIEAWKIIYLPHPQMFPWVADFLEECAQFPNGAHDDQVDAMTQILLRWHTAPTEETIVYGYSDRVVIGRF
jgi:phage terminase large subunit-like protein